MDRKGDYAYASRGMDRKSDYAYASRGMKEEGDYAISETELTLRTHKGTETFSLRTQPASRGMNRKGIANVIGIVLLILVGIVLIGVLWVYIYNALSAPGFSPAFSCFEMQLNPSILITKACYNNETGDLEVGIRRDKDEFNFDSFYLIFDSDNGSRTYCCGEDCGSCNIQGDSCDILEEGSNRNYYISGNGDEKSAVLRIFNCGVGQKDIVMC